ncbi:B12-binding domain-containing radical SAM protein, partial [Patescibacteria group bacterium]|nr:B12-binding domain-containing radical SAM protein [Patescibacteria group bacterium]
MKILLVQPSITERNVTSFMYPPMGLVALVAYLQKEGHQVSLYDANIEKETANEIIDLIKKESPEIVGFGIMSVNFSKSLALAKEIKSISKDIVIIAGGVHPTVEPEQTLKSQYIDFIVRGEGELTTTELLKAIEKKEENLKDIKGLGFKKNGKIILNPLRDLIQDISALPIPAYNLFNLKKYRAPYASRSPYMIMTRSRGCPFLCIFCGVGKMFGNRYRVQTPERSIKEVDYLVNQLGIKEIGFKDSEFTLAPKNVEKFCDLLIEKKYDLSWNCNGRI